MDGSPAALVDPVEYIFDESTSAASIARIIDFYEEAGSDYEHWSSGLNMHLGFYRWGSNPFNREAMLEQLNLEVADRLKIHPDDHLLLFDLGCGMGAVSRTIARKYPNAIIKGVTLAPSQVSIAGDVNAKLGLGNRIEIINDDYTALPFGDGLADGAWAVESACYASGPDKADLVREKARLLKPGGRFVVADCFVIDPEKHFNLFFKKCYLTACDAWAVTELPMLELFVGAMQKYGFTDIIIEDISWRIAPSLAHAPFAVLTFVLKKILTGKKLNKQSRGNLKASLLAIVLGLNRSKIRYCLVSGTRR
jgi:MPBQ/MSBQ methyltransferase